MVTTEGSPDPAAGPEQENFQALAPQHSARGANSVHAEPQTQPLHALQLIVPRARLGKSFSCARA